MPICGGAEGDEGGDVEACAPAPRPAADRRWGSAACGCLRRRSPDAGGCRRAPAAGAHSCRMRPFGTARIERAGGLRLQRGGGECGGHGRGSTRRAPGRKPQPGNRSMSAPQAEKKKKKRGGGERVSPAPAQLPAEPPAPRRGCRRWP